MLGSMNKPGIRMVDLVIQRHIKPYSPFDRSTVHVEDTAILTMICSSWDLVGIEARLRVDASATLELVGETSRNSLLVLSPLD